MNFENERLIVNNLFLKVMFNCPIKNELKQIDQYTDSVNNLKQLLVLDSLFVFGLKDNYAFEQNKDLLKGYVKDVVNNLNKAFVCNSYLNDTLTSKQDVYYSQIINTEYFNQKNFDKFGVLLDPVRTFINERKDIYDNNQEAELFTTSSKQEDLLLDLLKTRKKIVNKVEDLYVKKQFAYMEHAIKNKDLVENEPFKTYVKLKEQSLKSSQELVMMLQEGALFYKDLNSIGKAKPVKLKDLFSIDPFDLKETILDQDNFQLVDYSGKEIEAKKVNDLIKNLKFFKSDVINLARKNIQQSSIKM